MYTADQKLIIIIIQIKKGFSCRNFCALSEPFVRSVGFFLRFPLCKVCFFVWGTGTMPLPHLRESRHCCILNFTTWIPDSMYCTSFLLVELAFWIPIISGILQAQERFSLNPKSADRNPDSFTWGWGEAIHFTATTFKRNLILGEDQHECTRRGSTLTFLTVVGLLYASVMRHAHEPNCLLTYYAILRPFQSRSFPGTITGGILDYE